MENESELPGIGQLSSTPEILRALLEDLTAEQAQWKPAADRWSIAEILEHLSHVEGNGFRARVDAMVNEDNPHLPEYDQVAHAASGSYSGRDAEESFDHWEEQREDNVAFLDSLPAKAARRTGAHAVFGTITLGQLLNEWAFHDLGHIRQIAEIVRTLRYYPDMGPFQKIYQVNP